MSVPECCSNPPILNPTCGDGHVDRIGDLNCYISGSPHLKTAVILIHDGFGFEAPNFRKLADKVATSGFYVIVPDYFHGEPFDPSNTERPYEVWKKDHGPDGGFEKSKPLIEVLKQGGISKIGAAGFCWGGKVVVKLAQGDEIQAGVCLHPSFVTVEDVQGVKVPLAILGAENDHTCPAELVKQFENILKAKPEVDCFVKIFPGVSHGWTVRYDAEDPAAVEPAEEAHKDMLAWFQKHVKKED